MSDPNSVPQDAPRVGGQSSFWASVFIAAVLGLQVALAVGYYLTDDRFDERFAWRMYSTIRLSSCSTTAIDISRTGSQHRAVLSKTLAAAWINNIKRNREAVIRSALRRRCDSANVARARITNVCRVFGEQPVRYEWEIECETGEISPNHGVP